MTATSKTAKLSSNGENAYLQDDVRLTRSAYGIHSELTMLTTWLHVIPDDGIAQNRQAGAHSGRDHPDYVGWLRIQQ